MHKTPEPRQDNTNLGKLFDAYRRISGVGLRELAREIGVSAATLSRIERGYDFDLGTFAKLLEWFRS